MGTSWARTARRETYCPSIGSLDLRLPVVGTGVDPVTSRFSGRIGRIDAFASEQEMKLNFLVKVVIRALGERPLIRAVSPCFSLVGARLGHEA